MDPFLFFLTILEILSLASFAFYSWLMSDILFGLWKAKLEKRRKKRTGDHSPVHALSAEDLEWEIGS